MTHPTKAIFRWVLDDYIRVRSVVLCCVVRCTSWPIVLQRKRSLHSLAQPGALLARNTVRQHV
jgi:hypothetical protein